MGNRKRKALQTGMVLGIGVCAGVLGTMTATAQDVKVLEDQNPSFQKVEMRQWKDSFLTRVLACPEDRIHAYVGEFATFNDNIYVTQDDRKSDTIWTTVAGADVRFNKPEVYDFRTAANFKANNYHNYNASDNFEYDVAPSLGLTPNNMLRLSLDGSASKTVSPLLDSITVLNGRDIEQYNTGGGIKATLVPSDAYDVGLGYRINAKKYRDVVDPTTGADLYNNLEYTDQRVELTPTYALSDKTKVGIRATYGRDDYRQSLRNEPTWVEGCLTLNYVPDPKWVVAAAAGFQDRDYDTSGSAVRDTNDFKGFVFDTRVTYKYSEQWSYTLLALGAPQEASANQANFFVYNRQELKATYAPIAPLKLEAGLFNDLIDFVGPSVGADNQRRGASLGVTWSFCEYSGVGASYQHTLGNSEADGRDSRANVASVGAWLTF